MQRFFWGFSLVGFGLLLGLLYFNLPGAYWFAGGWLLYVVVGLYDLFFSPHTLNRLYPVAAYIRYFLEHIRPEIRQYFIASNTDERPFNRELRSLVYARAKGQRDTIPFGSERDQTATGFVTLRHSLLPCVVKPDESRVMVGNDQCRQPYLASRLNISAMSFGSLSANAIAALNFGAQKGGFAHNTGEGGISQYHLKGGDLIWQIGTGYFGCRTEDGRFDAESFREKAQQDHVKMIEVKLSQGAKPAHGGILPASKINAEIAGIRGIALGKDCVSPPSHPEFSTPIGLLQFLQQLRELSDGKPVGFKMCIGSEVEFLGICKAMLKTNIVPDFITADGGEGGTGAAPIEYSNRLGMLCVESVHFVDNCLKGIGLRDKIKIIASGKTASGYDLLEKIAVGADLVNAARTMMFALGCIQARSCNTNNCPTGVATQNPARSRALDVKAKSQRVFNYHKATVKSFLELVGALGIDDPEKLTPHDLYRRMDDGTTQRYGDIHLLVGDKQLLDGTAPPEYMQWWCNASADEFRPQIIAASNG